MNERRNAVDKKYKFLNDLLIETGDKLVQAVCTYFKWLGFSNVEAIDGNEDILREDIQITEEDKLYIIEVKGIGGTSTDAECSQVAKHRRKREKEHRDKEIIPIYIVNHQRYMRPSLRQNPPFSDNQIDYAENDERGLLTTWQLYNQYKLIENGVFTREETREDETMATKQIIFCAIMGLWALDALAMILTCKKDGVNWFGFIFIGFVPFIPFIAKLCGLS